MAFKFRLIPKRHYNDFTLLGIRLAAGCLMLTHGIPKMEKFLTGDTSFANPIGLGEEFTLILAVFAEVVCSIFIIIGLGTRIAVIPPLFTMFVAVFIIHISDPFKQIELPILYGVLYALLFIKGPGKWSIDRAIAKKGR